jgi:hypothetical protein
MSPRTLLLALALAAAPGLAQDGGYATEASATGSYEGGSTEEPLVVIGGAPAPGFVYRDDEIERALGASATRYFPAVVDDGGTPFALLPFVARSSSVRVDVSLASRSDDSTGTSTGQQVSLTSGFTGDRTTRGAGLSGEWFFERGTSARAGISGTWTRETDATTQVESPSGRGDLAEIGTRTSAGRATFGVARRFGSGPDARTGLFRGLEAEVAADGSYGWRLNTQHEELLFSESGFRAFDYELSSRTRGLSLSTRALLLSRRLLVEARGSYTSASGALTQAPDVKIDHSTAIVRSLSGTVTFHPSRALGVGAGLTYATETDAGGLVSVQRTEAIKTLSWLVSARWFVTPRASIAAAFTRAEGTTLLPPQGATFQRFEETTNRVELQGSLRF